MISVKCRRVNYATSSTHTYFNPPGSCLFFFIMFCCCCCYCRHWPHVYVSVCFINRKASVLLNRLTSSLTSTKHNGFIYLIEFHDTAKITIRTYTKSDGTKCETTLKRVELYMHERTLPIEMYIHIVLSVYYSISYVRI